jgi:uncharacterized LabA/DUF88 family protein
MPKEKVAILIDGSNFYYKLKDLNLHDQLKFDFNSFSKYLANGDKIVDKKYYIGSVRKNKNKKSLQMHADQQKLFAHLKKHGFYYKLGYLLETKGKYHEKGVDVQIAIDLLAHAYENTVDKISLVSSDTDLIPAIKKSLSIGVKVEYVGFSHSKSVALVASCPTSILLTKTELQKYIT